MGRQMISDLDMIFSIVETGAGKVSPWKQNVRPCKCAACAKALEPGRGKRFTKARHSDEEYGYSGYLCDACVATMLQRVERWHWNRFFFILQPSEYYIGTLNGTVLAAAWKRGGLPRLAQCLQRSV
ncbi:MAG TPA: hypothetical protein DCS05_08055 [Nitrospiraceae bacterium]|nr:hypothetical protein [Nitrospiraceae bacterium]